MRPYEICFIVLAIRTRAIRFPGMNRALSRTIVTQGGKVSVEDWGRRHSPTRSTSL